MHLLSILAIVAESVDPDMETMTILESMPIMVMTTKSSSNVKALFFI